VLLYYELRACRAAAFCGGFSVIILPALMFGEVPEWLNGTVSKTVVGSGPPRVRIPPSPLKVRLRNRAFFFFPRAPSLRGWYPNPSLSAESPTDIVGLFSFSNRPSVVRFQTMKLNLALAQINTKLGDIEANLDKHLEYIQQAKAQKADLLVFPELSLTGYVLQDLVASVARKPMEDDSIFKPLLAASRDIDLVVGFVDEDSRHRFYIASAYLSGGKLIHVHHKVYLPTYGLFDEGRFFAWGDSVRAFDTRFGRLGMLICEDFWHASPPYLLWLDGADIMLFSSASPGRGLNDKEKLESARWVERVNKAYASMFTSFVAHANRVGYEDGLHFWGGATIFDPNGEELAHGPYNEEAITYAELDLNQLRRTRARLPLLRDERTALVQKEMARILSRG
jgi:NAD+ synthase (glutamine-hydrolysing)